MQATSDHEERALAVARRIAWSGPLVGVIGAALLGIWGASGAAGLAVVLLSSSASCLLASFVTAAWAMFDEYRRVGVGRRRILTAAGLFAAGGALLVMTVGAAATV